MEPANTRVARRSARLCTKGGASAPGTTDDRAELGPSTSTDLDLDFVPAKRRKKTARATATPVQKTGGRSRKRSLSKLPDMPLDILFEIFGHLHPIDVLHLARTSKSLRNVLMQRSAVSIWRQARAHISDLPDCPTDLNEPQYANLLFDPHCHFCLKARVLTVMWSCRVRCCKQCLHEHFVDLTTMFLSLPESPLRPGAMLPIHEVKNKLLFPRTKVIELGETLAGMIGDHEKMKQLEEERILAVQDQEAHAALLEEWHFTQSAQRSVHLVRLRFERRRAIISRLVALGMGDDLDCMDDDALRAFSEHPLVRQPKELTDRIWNNVKEPIIALVMEARAIRQAKERCLRICRRLPMVCETVFEYIYKRPLTEYLPGVADFCAMPEFLNILALPADVEVDANLFAPVKQQFPNLVERWRAETTSEVLKLIPSIDASGPRNPGSVELATTWFSCPSCPDNTISYPRVLVHECTARICDDSMDVVSREPAAELRNALKLTLEELPWSAQVAGLRFNMIAYESARALVESCGLDPNTTTARDMDERDSRFICMDCARVSHSEAVVVMTWRKAVLHSTITLSFHGDWLQLNDEDAARAKAREEMWEDNDRNMCAHWVCGKCRKIEDSADFIQRHLGYIHNIENPVEGQDYAPHLDADFGDHDPFPRSHPVYIFSIASEKFP